MPDRKHLNVSGAVFILVFILAGLSACNFNHFERSFQPVAGWRSHHTGTPVVPELNYTQNIEEATIELLEDGYQHIGIAEFDSREFNDRRQAIVFAKKIGATVVLLRSEFERTAQLHTEYNHVTNHTILPASPFAMPRTDYNVSYNFETGKLRESVTTTTAHPVVAATHTRTVHHETVDLYHYYASFWVKDPRLPVLGIHASQLPEQLRRDLKLNHGVRVGAVQQGSPAAKALIYRGDILLSINGEVLRDVQALDGLISKYAGTTIKLELLQQGERVIREMELNPHTP